MAAGYVIKRNDKVGRFAVAARDLAAGEEVLVELPLALGPKACSPPVCLGCHTPWELQDVCEECGWPVCGPECAAETLHRDAECRVFAEARVRFNAEAADADSPSPQYECITPLRMLLAKEREPDRWSAEVEEMESHTEKRKLSLEWNNEHINIVNFLRFKCGLADRFSEELVHWVTGVLVVNAFEVQTDKGDFIRGLYPRTSVMSHNCVANTTHTYYPTHGYRSQVRTTVKVVEGEELYASYTSSIQPTLTRREHIKYSKYFDCDCKRCADPTELGTHLGSLKCTKCSHGVITSFNPLGSCAVWGCSHCEYTICSESVKKIFTLIQEEFQQIELIDVPDHKIEEAEKLLKKYWSVLHPKNVYFISLKHTLIQLYGGAPGYEVLELPDTLLERKIELCRQVLEVVDVVKPGMNRFRGMILYELHFPLILYNRHKYECKELSAEEFKRKMKEVLKVLEEAVNILCLEEPTSPEGKIGEVGKRSLEQLRFSIEEEFSSFKT